jgi:hypothetical protein
MHGLRGFAGLAAFLTIGGILAGGCAKASTNTGGSGGNGGDGSTSSTSSSSSSSSSGAGGCTMAADCMSMSDACNVGACVNGVCAKQPANDLGACDDGLFCTDNDSCMAGACIGQSAHLCQAADGCHIATCDEGQKKCVETPGNNGASCSPADLCSTSGVCNAGSCVGTGQIDCSFLTDACNTGKCDKMKGCVAVPIADNTPCDDGLFCTVADKCTTGKCGGSPNMCAPPGTPCQVGVCDENNKTCAAAVAPDGAACTTGNVCKSGETCVAGACQGGLPANNGGACSDGNGCDVGTTCLNGTCGNPTMVISQCLANDKCCPAGCMGVDADCSPILVGSYTIGMGPNWTTNPPTQTCQEACALVFGGNAAQYSCSTTAAPVDHMAWADGYADTTHCQGNGNPVAENYKLNTAYDCGVFGCAYSAYVSDNCPSSTNYCFK